MDEKGYFLNNKGKVRSSNIELLRIVAMFMIVTYHIVVHCVDVQLTSSDASGVAAYGFFDHPVFYKRILILNTIMTFGIVGNAIFILISGYFLANRTDDEKSGTIRIGDIAKKLLLQMGFAAIVLVLASTLGHQWKPGVFSYLPSITVFNDMAWFVGYYFLVVLCGELFLNKFLARLDYKKYAGFLLALLGLLSFSFSGTLAESIGTGLRTVLTGLFLYSLGGFIRKYDPFRKVRTYIFFLIAAVVYIFIWISAYNETETNINTYISGKSTDPFMQSVPTFDNFSIVIILLAICMFEVFRRIHLPGSRGLTFLGKSTFMVYLLHDNNCFYELWNRKNWVAALTGSPWRFLLSLLEWAGCTFAAGVIVYILYGWAMALLKKGKILALRRNSAE